MFAPAWPRRNLLARIRSRDHPLVQLTLVRFLEFIREPEALFWVFVFPDSSCGGIGHRVSQSSGRKCSRIAVVTPELAQSLRQEKLLDVQQLDAHAAQEALRTGKVALLAAPGSSGAVEYRYDDTNPEGRAARLLADRAIQKAAGRVDPVATSDQLMRETGSRYIDFLIPGLLGMNLMGSAIWSMGFAIVDARRKKLLKRLVASPMPRPYYLLSFLLSRILLLVVEVGVLVGFGALLFHVPVRGSLLDLGVLCLLSSLSFSALGLLLASRARTIEAASGLMNLVMMPMWIASGVFFSSQKFPDVMQPFIKVLPLDRRHRRPAREHAARLEFGANGPASRNHRLLAGDLFRAGAKTFPLAVGRDFSRTGFSLWGLVLASRNPTG